MISEKEIHCRGVAPNSFLVFNSDAYLKLNEIHGLLGKQQGKRMMGALLTTPVVPLKFSSLLIFSQFLW